MNTDRNAPHKRVSRQIKEQSRQQWQPIDDEARNGEERILSDGIYTITGKWIRTPHDIDWGCEFCFMSEHRLIDPQPTHWMPLPAPPMSDE